ncbi:YgjV family protein [Vibrio sp. SS-MA-C1-2]|uniref:YgjV family protein n=1 Tax=Vibrio sp. SS-MA-C1-2 TaxID=2908646 RepID=UPI001F2C9F88|nr:YgjV family protein [Vibrio sp. SS-MA-C1-2]UJF20036.1 YgjV family protein [Vibrio sp. SS-MA-C1-2]
MSETMIQAIGFLALIVNLIGSSCISDKRMRIFLFCSCTLFSIHFTLLGGFVAGINLFINAVRSLVSIKFTGTKMFVLFLIIQTSLSYFFYQSPTDLIPLMASTVSCYALFMCKGIAMRFAFLICTLLWLINAVVLGSYGGAINDMINATILATTIYRLSRREKVEVV